jgi:hypothetical protein
LIAVIAAAIVFLSEGVARRREERRRQLADAAAEGCSASTGVGDLSGQMLLRESRRSRSVTNAR